MSGIRHFARVADALREEARMLERVATRESDREAVLWTTGQSLVAPGAMQRHPGFAQAAKESAQYGWPVELRSSGGGLVPQGPGILNMTLVYVPGKEGHTKLRRSYGVLTEPISRAVGNRGAVSIGPVAGSFCDGDYNVAVNGRKLAGTAQRWTRRRDVSDDHVVLAHAVILCSAALPDVCRAINAMSARMGDKPRAHPASHVNFADLSPSAGDASELLGAKLNAALAAAWSGSDIPRSHAISSCATF